MDLEVAHDTGLSAWENCTGNEHCTKYGLNTRGHYFTTV